MTESKPDTVWNREHVNGARCTVQADGTRFVAYVVHGPQHQMTSPHYADTLQAAKDAADDVARKDGHSCAIPGCQKWWS